MAPHHASAEERRREEGFKCPFRPLHLYDHKFSSRDRNPKQKQKAEARSADRSKPTQINQIDVHFFLLFYVSPPRTVPGRPARCLPRFHSGTRCSWLGSHSGAALQTASLVCLCLVCLRASFIYPHSNEPALFARLGRIQDGQCAHRASLFLDVHALRNNNRPLLALSVSMCVILPIALSIQ